MTKKRKQLVYFDRQKCKLSLATPSLRQQLMLLLCLYRVIETRFNQSALVFCGGYFLIWRTRLLEQNLKILIVDSNKFT